MSELALAVRPRARPPLELAADLQRQPLCVADLRHVHGHVGAGGCGRLIGRRGGRGKRRLCLRPSVCDDCGSGGGETGWAKDMGNVRSEDVSSEAVLCSQVDYGKEAALARAYHLRLILEGFGS